MEPSDSYNCAIRVKEEHNYALLIENNSGIIDEKPDLKNLQLLLLPPENSIQTVRECDEHRESELDNEVEITFECENLKPQMNLSVLEKIDNYSQSYLWNVKDSDGCEMQNIIKSETTGKAKQEFIGDIAEKSHLNFDGELFSQDKRRIITKKLNNKHNLKKTHISTMNSDTTHACRICGKKYIKKGCLKAHIDKVHNNAICYICRKTFAYKSYLQTHIDLMHITHACDICQKTFTQKCKLKVQIDAVHNGIKHTCDISGKKFSNKSNLKKHIDTVHKRVIHSCDICSKPFDHIRDMKAYIGAVHNSITKASDRSRKNVTVSTTSNGLSADETLIRCISRVLQLNKNISSEN